MASVSLVVGNTATAVPGKEGWFDWVVFVREERARCRGPRAVDVTFRLHETFSPNVVRAKARAASEGGTCWTLRRRGWGTFDIGVTVVVGDGSGSAPVKIEQLVHSLSFANGGTEQVVHIDIDIDGDVDMEGDGKSDVGEIESSPTNAAPPRVEQVPRMTGVPAAEMHGTRGAVHGWAAPRITRECDEMARPGYNSMQAHEYADEPQVLREKVALLAAMLRESNDACAYTGAGISTSSGINDYATKGEPTRNRARKKTSPFDAQPTPSHHVLAALHRAGCLKHWVQQNHDGLPQKAGFPQHALNEIHGAWHDPSNPVVPMQGSLRTDLYEWLIEWEERADLVLALGTSLCGMNADRMVTTVASKARTGNAVGAVIISLQRTALDDQAALRIFGKLDDVMRALDQEMSLGSFQARNSARARASMSSTSSDGVYHVPYDRTGSRTAQKGRRINGIHWDLRQGQRIVVTAGPGKGFRGIMGTKLPSGDHQVLLPRQREGSADFGTGQVRYILGSWWIDAALQGSVPKLPIVNV